MKPVKSFFVYKCKLGLALLYLADMFINKLMTKFTSFFLQNGFKLLLKKFPRNSQTNALKNKFGKKRDGR